jgi:hypothetical protein
MVLNSVQAVMLVGGFAASDWLFNNLRTRLQSINLPLSRPDGHLCVHHFNYSVRSDLMSVGHRGKAVADGAVSYQLDHFVSVRVARTTFGTECTVAFDKNNPEHSRRSHTIMTFPSGRHRIPEAFDVILAKVLRSFIDKSRIDHNL